MTHGRDRPVAYWLGNLYPVALAIGGVAVAVVLPESWGPDSGPLSGVTRIVSHVVPSIAKVSAVSVFPGVTATYLALLWLLLPLLVWASKQMLDVQSGTAAGRTMWPPDGRSPIYSIVLLLFGALLFYLMIVVPIVGFSFEPADLDNATKGGRWLSRFSQSRLWLGVLGALTVWLCSVGIALVLRVLTMIFGRR